MYRHADAKNHLLRKIDAAVDFKYIYDLVKKLVRQKQYLTNLEKDILATTNELIKNPFYRETAERQVKKNNLNHSNIFAVISAYPTTVVRPFNETTDADIRYNLNHQLDALIAKKLEELNRRK